VSETFSPTDIRAMGATVAGTAATAIARAKTEVAGVSGVRLPAFLHGQEGELNHLLNRLPGSFDFLAQMAESFGQKTEVAARSYASMEATNTQAASTAFEA
jgi:hypothetical protein